MKKNTDIILIWVGILEMVALTSIFLFSPSVTRILIAVVLCLIYFHSFLLKIGVTGAASPFRQFAAGFVGFKCNTKPMLAILTDWHYLYSLISTFSKSDDSDGCDGFSYIADLLSSPSLPSFFFK